MKKMVILVILYYFSGSGIPSFQFSFWQVVNFQLLHPWITGTRGVADSWLRRMTQPKTQTPHVPRLQWWVFHHGMSRIPTTAPASRRQRRSLKSEGFMLILSFHFLSFHFRYVSLRFVSFHSVTHSLISSSVPLFVHLRVSIVVVSSLPLSPVTSNTYYQWQTPTWSGKHAINKFNIGHNNSTVLVSDCPNFQRCPVGFFPASCCYLCKWKAFLPFTTSWGVPK